MDETAGVSLIAISLNATMTIGAREMDLVFTERGCCGACIEGLESCNSSLPWFTITILSNNGATPRQNGGCE
jgi:hypothetical protein